MNTVYITKYDYEILKRNGTITKDGVTHTFDPDNNLYFIDNEDRNASIAALGKVERYYGEPYFTDTAVYQANGTSRTFSGWFSTGFIDCEGAETVKYESCGYADSNIDVAYISFFNASYQMISCLKSSDDSPASGVKRGTVAVPQGAAYVRGLKAGDNDPYIQVNATGIIKDVADLKKTLPITSGMKICVVGDSLTQGVDIGSHLITENYPYFMSQQLNCEIVNYGQMGRSSKTWWDNYKDVHLFDPSMDIVLIMFGTNGGLTQNTLATDVEPFTDPDDYAENSVGCFCRLIEKIQIDTQHHAQIVLLTPPYSSYSASQTQTVINTAPVVKAIAARYHLPVIDVLNECGMDEFNGHIFRPHDGCHFNAKGYHKLGTFIGSQVLSLASTWKATDTYTDEAPTETWEMRETLNTGLNAEYDAFFTSNGRLYSKVQMSYEPMPTDLQTVSYITSSGITDTVCTGYMITQWTDAAYRTIVLGKPAEGNFLTWLQANAVKQ